MKRRKVVVDFYVYDNEEDRVVGEANAVLLVVDLMRIGIATADPSVRTNMTYSFGYTDTEEVPSEPGS